VKKTSILFLVLAILSIALIQMGCKKGINKIAFISNRDGNYEIYVMDTNGANKTNITKNNASDINHAWSPDGTKIAFISHNNGLSGELYVMNIDGSELKGLNVGASFSQSLSWSPDSKKIAFTAGDIGIINSDGTGLTNLTSNNYQSPHAPSWSPDGSKIAFFSSTIDQGDRLYVIGTDGSGSMKLADEVNQLYQSAPLWWPDNSKIAFYSNSQGDDSSGIYTVNANGTGLTLFNDEIIWDSPSWSPDGSKITFTNRNEIYVINANGTDLTNLTDNLAIDSSPAWSANSTRIVFYSDRTGNAEIYVMNADGTNQTRITNNPADDTNPVWAP
jgi:Tol biopolymer transport system component